MCKTQKNTPTFTVCNKTNSENNLPKLSQSVFKNLSKAGLPVFSVQAFM